MTPKASSHHARQSRLRKLLGNLTLKSLSIQKKGNKIGALGPAEGLKPSLFQKLTGWMEQIAGLREKENDLISEITAIEKKHGQMRKAQKLRCAAPAPKKDPTQDFDEDEEKPHNRFWMWVLLFLMMTHKRKKPDAPKNG